MKRLINAELLKKAIEPMKKDCVVGSYKRETYEKIINLIDEQPTAKAQPKADKKMRKIGFEKVAEIKEGVTYRDINTGDAIRIEQAEPNIGYTLEKIDGDTDTHRIIDGKVLKYIDRKAEEKGWK